MNEVTISRLAREAGVKADTVRYYERVGLLPAPRRTDAGYRVYSPEFVDRLRFIKGGQRLGLSLADIRELLEVHDRGSCPCGHTDAVVRRRLAEVDTEITRLTELRRELASLEGCLSECAPVSAWPCRLDVDFWKGGDET